MQKQAIIIFLISLATADVLYFDQEYSLVPESQRRSELDKEIMAKKLDSKHDYPPSVCQDFRSGLLAAVDNYANLVKKHRQSKGFLTAFYELFVTENLRTLKLAQQEAWKETVLLDSDIKAYIRLNERRSSVTSFRSSMSSSMSDWMGTSMSTTMSMSSSLIGAFRRNSILGNQPQNKEVDRKVLPEAYKTLDNFSLINRITHWPLKDAEYSQIAHEISWVDGELLGQHMAKLLISKEWVCHSVSEISLTVFKLFYLRILPMDKLECFFYGFFNHLEDAAEEKGMAGLYAADVIKEFFGFNLFVMLGFENDMATSLTRMFAQATPGTHNDELRDNFAQLYRLVLDTISRYEDETDGDKKRLYEQFLAMDRTALKKVLGAGTFLSIVYSISFFKGMALSPLGPYLSVIVSEHTNFLSNALVDGLAEYFPKLHGDHSRTQERLAMAIQHRAKNFNAANLADFLSHFENTVKGHKACSMCRVHHEIRHERLKASQLVLNASQLGLNASQKGLKVRI